MHFFPFFSFASNIKYNDIFPLINRKRAQFCILNYEQKSREVIHLNSWNLGWLTRQVKVICWMVSLAL